MIRALIVDDEPLARQLLREYLQAHPDVALVGECDNGLDALQALREDTPGGAPDLVLLDIQMPQLSGLEVLELSGRDHGVVLCTAYDQHALKAFELHALDYLLKPFSQARFNQALAQARKVLGQRNAALQQLATPALGPLQRLLIRERNQVQVVALHNVDCIEAQDDYVCIHTAAKSHLKTQSLSDLQTQLDPQRFVRVHRSWIINMEHLAQLQRSAKDSMVAVLRSGRTVPISRAGHERIKALL